MMSPSTRRPAAEPASTEATAAARFPRFVHGAGPPDSRRRGGRWGETQLGPGLNGAMFRRPRYRSSPHGRGFGPELIGAMFEPDSCPAIQDAVRTPKGATAAALSRFVSSNIRNRPPGDTKTDPLLDQWNGADGGYPRFVHGDDPRSIKSRWAKGG